MQELVEWQINDDENGLVMPWFTHTCLNWMKDQDWRDKNILEFGAGLGDGWMANKCKKLMVIERNKEWIQTVGTYIYRPCNDSDGNAVYYLEIPKDFEPDIIINDDAYRTECCQMAVDYFSKKEGGGILISDNWVQSFVWMSPKAEEIMKPYESLVFEQENHTNNDGVNKWKTAVHFIK